MKQLILALSLMFGMSACLPNFSNGVRVGVVTKLSHKGILFKSWEGELLIALPATVSALNPERVFFTAEPEAVPALQAAMTTGARVELTYHQWWMMPFTQDSPYSVTAVKEAK